MNLLFIITMSISTKLFFDTWGRNFGQNKRNFLTYVSSLISILFCMTFSFTVGDQYRFDLRAIPLILGGLLGGPVVSFALFGSMVGYRFLLGYDSGFWGNVINYGVLVVPLALFSLSFRNSTAMKRFLIAGTLIITHIILSRLIYNYLFVSGLPLDIFLEASIIKVVFTVISALFLEGVFRYQELQEHHTYNEKMKLVNHLSASISHEIRNGLTSAIGFLQLLHEREEEPKKLEYIHYALDELNRTETIIRDFLTFSKPNPKQRKWVEVESILGNSLSLIEPLASRHAVEIRKDTQNFTLYGDESLFQQAIMNILKNAVEAMPNGGVLEVQTIHGVKNHMLTIKYTGMGLSQEQLARMGTPYYTTKGQKGTGLGLMVAYRVIEELRGTIKVSSKVGAGTTFIISFPSGE